jgi:hypothetical protein
VLRYDSNLGGYVVNIDRSKLEGAPSYETSDSSRWDDDTWGGRVNDYYGRPSGSDIGFASPGLPGIGRGTPII